MIRTMVRYGAALVAATVLLPRAASGQGFGVYEQGACVMGRAGTGVASPCADGSTVFFNPANLSGTPDVISLGGTLILPRGGFTNDLTGVRSDMLDKVRPVPNLYIVKGFALPGGLDRLALGVGVFAPYGLTTEWPATSEERFLGYRSDIRAIYVQPTAAIRFAKRFSLGAGLDVNFAHLELRQRVDLSSQPAIGELTFANLGVATGTDFADADLSANEVHLGFHVGLGVKLTDWLDLGARYLSRQSVGFDNGTVRIEQVPTGLLVPAALPGIPAGTPVDALVASQFTDGVLTDQSATTQIGADGTSTTELRRTTLWCPTSPRAIVRPSPSGSGPGWEPASGSMLRISTSTRAIGEAERCRSISRYAAAGRPVLRWCSKTMVSTPSTRTFSVQPSHTGSDPGESSV